LGARYLIIGGLAMIHAGYPRFTADVDLIIALDPENEARVYEALRSLPDRAVDDLDPGDVAKYTVVRVNDEITVDLMGSASGIRYEEAIEYAVIRRIGDVDVPFASPRLLWRMKKSTHREKDAADLRFLEKWFEARGEEPPE
jgi:predicted nucleotidyltransferase